MHRAHVIIVMLAVIGGGLSACTYAGRSGGPRQGEVGYTLVYLKTGPNSASHTPEEKKEIFKGHMANMQRLAAEETLLIAGPFIQPKDKTWRGIFVFDIKDAARARSIAASDPGVSSGEFVAEVRPVWGSPGLRESLRFEKELQEELKALGQPERTPGEPPTGLRPYVIAHADDVDRATSALAAALHAAPGSAPAPPRVVWSVRFRGSPAGVLVLNAGNAQATQDALAHIDTGPIRCSGWFSTQSLEKLKVGKTK